MSTSEPREGLPNLGAITALANEFYRNTAGVVALDGLASPVTPPAPLSAPPAPISPPAPAVVPRLHTVPPASAGGLGSPIPGTPAVDLPRVPFATETLAPGFGVPGASRGPGVPTSTGAYGVPVLGVAPGLGGTSGISVPTVSPAVPTLDAATLSPLPAGAKGHQAPSAPAVPPATPGTLGELTFARIGLDFPLVPVPQAPSPIAATSFAIDRPAVDAAGAHAFRPDLVPALGASARPFDANAARRDFPLLRTTVHGKPLVWLDNAATTQKPQAVIDRISRFYEHENSNIHRAAHALAARATDAYESARESVRRFINAPSTQQIVFVRGTTEGINLIAKSWGAANVGEGEEILITHLEHHANIVPWQQLCAATGAVLRVAPVDDNGDVLIPEFEALITDRTKLVSFTMVSNALGTVTPAPVLIGIAHAHGVPVVLDVAQGIAHARVDVRALDVDFLVFSGHKVFGPTGVGVVYGKPEVLEGMPPWEGGGNMIADVTFERTLFHGPPARFEAGTGNIADAVGLGAALDYLSGWDIDAVAAYEHGLIDYLVAQLKTVSGVHLVGAPTVRAGAVSFTLDGFTTQEVGEALDKDGIAVRSGHHCAQPILRRFGVETSVRPSLALYNTTGDVDALIGSLHRIAATRR